MDSGKSSLLPQSHLFHSLSNVFVGLCHSDFGIQRLDPEAYTLWREELPHWVWVLGWRRMRGRGTRQLGEGAKLLKSPFSVVSSANSSFLFNLSSHGESYTVYMEDRGLLGHLLPCHNASCEKMPAMLATSRDA